MWLLGRSHRSPSFLGRLVSPGSVGISTVPPIRRFLDLNFSLPFAEVDFKPIQVRPISPRKTAKMDEHIPVAGRTGHCGWASPYLNLRASPGLPCWGVAASRKGIKKLHLHSQLPCHADCCNGRRYWFPAGPSAVCQGRRGGHTLFQRQEIHLSGILMGLINSPNPGLPSGMEGVKSFIPSKIYSRNNLVSLPWRCAYKNYVCNLTSDYSYS